MEKFTGFEYLCIDVANQYGLDKLLFRERIQWVYDNIHQLEALTPSSEKKERPQYVKAVMALREAQKGIPTGHLVGFDGVCSGVQIMSAITGCYEGAKATGLVDPNVRADAYTECTDRMRAYLGSVDAVSRADAKKAFMTAFYGSRATPKRIFGEGTKALHTFYRVMQEMAAGAWELLHILLDSWNPNADAHSWYLPDGYFAHVPVSEERTVRIEVDELDHATFTYKYEHFGPIERGLSNVANVTHSIDAYVLRNMHRRCNYDPALVKQALETINKGKEYYALGGVTLDAVQGSKLATAVHRFKQSAIADTSILPLLIGDAYLYVPEDILLKVEEILLTMLEHEPFEIVTIHDEFQAHPNNLNHLRMHYRNILADLADSEIVSDILSQLFGQPVQYQKKSNNLSGYIMNSNYFLS